MSQTDALWRYLLNPTLRLKLHENQRLPAPATASAAAAANGEAVLWHWRLKMQSMIDNGANGNVRSRPVAVSHDILFGPGRKTAAHGLVKNTVQLRKSDTPSAHRFVAKSLCPNLISALDSRLTALMSTSLAPLPASAASCSRFDQSARLQQLQILRHAVENNVACTSGGSDSSASQRLKSELLSWRSCVAWMVTKTASSSPSSSPSVAAASTQGLMPQSVFVALGSRIGQLCSLESSPDEAGAAASRADFVKILARDWASVVAAGKLCSASGAVLFQHWFTGVLLPVAIVLAPSASCANEDSLFEHVADFVSTLRKILFPEETVTVESMNNNSTAKHSHTKEAAFLPQVAAKAMTQYKSKSAASVVVGGGADRPIHFSSVYEQRFAPAGFLTPIKRAASPTPASAQRRSAALRSSSSASAGKHCRPSPPASSGSTVLVVDRTLLPRRTPKRLEALLERQQQHQQTLKRGESPEREKPALHVCLMDFSEARRPMTSSSSTHALPPSPHAIQTTKATSASSLSPSPGRRHHHQPIETGSAPVARTIKSAIPRELAQRKLVGVPIGSELRLDE